MKTVLKIWNVVSWTLVAIIAALAVLLAGVRLFGFQVFTVLSGSMEPVYHVGSVIYVKDVDYRDLKEGDPITYMLDEDTVATHRIVGIVPDEEDPTVLRYRTKGDANENEDASLVHYKNVIGMPVFTIPYLGYLASYIQQPPGNRKPGGWGRPLPKSQEHQKEQCQAAADTAAQDHGLAGSCWICACPESQNRHGHCHGQQLLRNLHGCQCADPVGSGKIAGHYAAQAADRKKTAV